MEKTFTGRIVHKPIIIKSGTNPKYKSLDHKSTAVIVKNKREYDFINSWGEENNRLSLELQDIKYPVFICTGIDGLMWTNSSDRALYYISFDEFLSKIGYKI